MQLKLHDFFGDEIPQVQEFPFATLKFSSISLDYWIRLQREYGLGLEDFAQLQSGQPLDVLDVLIPMLHAATWQYVREEYSFQAWKDLLWVWATSYSVLLEWFVQYISQSLSDAREGEIKRPKS